MKVFRVISALVLAILVLVSSTNFLVGIHFCMGDVQNVTLFSESSGCEMPKKIIPPCHKHVQEPCCDDETVVHESDDVFASQNEATVVGPDSLHLAALPVFIADIVPSNTLAQTYRPLYDPPLRSPDYTVDFRTLWI